MNNKKTLNKNTKVKSIKFLNIFSIYKYTERNIKHIEINLLNICYLISFKRCF